MICDRLSSLYVKFSLKGLRTRSGDDKIKTLGRVVSSYRSNETDEMYSHRYSLTQEVKVIPPWVAGLI